MILDERHEDAAERLVRNEPSNAIARVLNVDSATIRKWRANEDFQKLIEHKRREILGYRYSAVTPLVLKAVDSVDHFIELVKNGGGQDKAHLLGLRSMVTVLGKLTKIEAADREQQGVIVASKSTGSVAPGSRDLDALGVESGE